VRKPIESSGGALPGSLVYRNKGPSLPAEELGERLGRTKGFLPVVADGQFLVSYIGEEKRMKVSHETL